LATDMDTETDMETDTDTDRDTGTRHELGHGHEKLLYGNPVFEPPKKRLTQL
jgi:hypothetical protein